MIANSKSIRNILKICFSIMDLERFKVHCETLVKNIDEIIKEKDSFLIIPICQNCCSKMKHCGREIKFKNDLYRVY